MNAVDRKLKKVREILEEKNLDAILVSSRSNLIYLTGYPFFLDDREAFLIITHDKSFALVSGLIQTELKIKAPFLTFSDPNASPRRLSTYLSELSKKESFQHIGFEANDLTVEEYTNLKNQNITFVPVNLNSIRNIKGKEEIEAIAKACTLGDQAFSYILKEVKPGITEKELAFLLETYIREKGAKPSFEAIIAFGPNSAVIHHLSDETKLKSKDNILFDFGVKVDNYCSDMSRTVFIGKPSAEQKKIYETVRIAQEKSFEYLQNFRVAGEEGIPLTRTETKSKEHLREGNERQDPKILAKGIDSVARNYVISQGYPNFPHSSHGIGIEIHEAPSLSPASTEVIKPGMVFSVEPGVYIPGFMGVRIEDIVTMTEKGPKILTTSPRELAML